MSACWLQYASDQKVLCVLHGVLLGLLLISLAADLRTAYRRWQGGVGARDKSEATVKRGYQSMSGLYAFYVVVSVVVPLAVQVAEGVEGYKAGIIVIDYVVLSYLFFFNSWFRNALVFPVLQRIRVD